ncbi:MAG: ankyrin repeat domain-containing protein [bacterium]
MGGETVLHKAAENGNLENVIRLLRKGCDPFI